VDEAELIHSVRKIDIVASAYPEDVVLSLLGGDTDIHFLQKPFDESEFVSTVVEILAGRY
jgi:hypothetical protein